MAINPVCSIPGCINPPLAHGWCPAHYQRWRRHGDPVGGNTSRGEPLRYLLDTVLAYDGDDCLPWPYAQDQNNHGKVWHEGKVKRVARLVCELAHGPAPTPEHEAAHSCGKAHEACCAKRHLSWKTPVANQADKIVHGTTNRGERCGTSKFTEADIREIRMLKGYMLQREIAEMYETTQGHVSSIHSEERWGWLTEEAH